MYSIVAEVIIFIATEVLVMLDSSTWPDVFFWVTLGSVSLLNGIRALFTKTIFIFYDFVMHFFIFTVANGIYQNTVYGIAARLPAAYTGAIILGNVRKFR